MRILAMTATSVLVILCFILFWPMPGEYDPSGITFDIRGQDVIAMEEIQQTQQEAKKPPPPAPVPPVVFPDDVVLDEVEFVAEDNLLSIEEAGVDEEFAEGPPVTSSPPARADSGPRPFRIVEPEHPDAAKRKKIRAEVIVKVLVNKEGAVTEASIIQRYLLNKDKTEREAVALVGYGVEEAALLAAERWMFRPAREGGKLVQSYTELTFSFGV